MASFNRLFLATIHAEVRERFPDLRPMRDARVHRTGFGRYEFHGPEKFYDHFRADDAYHARAKGWQAYLNKRA